MNLSEGVLEKVLEVSDPGLRDALIEFIESIEYPVIVEGKNDAKMMSYFGITDVIELNKGASIYETVEALKDQDRIIILTDFDRKGKQLRRRLIREFGLWGISEHKKPRTLFSRLHLEHVEDLKSLKPPL